MVDNVGRVKGSELSYFEFAGITNMQDKIVR